MTTALRLAAVLALVIDMTLAAVVPPALALDMATAAMALAYAALIVPRTRGAVEPVVVPVAAPVVRRGYPRGPVPVA